MYTAAVSEIKASLSEYLGKVKAGEDILITERGRPIARIVPLRRDGQITGQLEHLEKRGLIKIGCGGLSDDLLAADAMQLAAALVWADGNPDQRGFVCLDQRLREAARSEGFSLFPRDL